MTGLTTYEITFRLSLSSALPVAKVKDDVRRKQGLPAGHPVSAIDAGRELQ